MAKQKIPLRATSAAAHEVGAPTSWVSLAVRRGIVEPVHDSNGRALFSDADIARLRKYRRKQMRKMPNAISETTA
jgi:hypothetical protein